MISLKNDTENDLEKPTNMCRSSKTMHYSFSLVFRLLSYFLPSLYTLYFQLTSLFSEVGLNIQEAHVFSTIDGYSLDVFVVDGWAYEVSLPFTDKFILFQGLLLLNYLVWLTCFPCAKKISGN